MDLQLTLIFPLALFLFMVLKGFGSKLHNRASKLPPQPWKLPIIGHLHHLLVPLPHHTLANLAKKHGPLVYLQLGEVPSIVASSPRMAKEILKTQGTMFADRGADLAGKIMTYDNAGIIFSPYNGHWRQLRKICTLELLSAKKVQSFLSVREEEVTNLVKSISSMAAGSPVNLSHKIFTLTNDITSRAAFGAKCNEKDTFLSLVNEMIQLAGGFSVSNVFPSLKFLHRISGVMSKLEKIHQKVDKILEDIVNEHRLNRMRKEKMEEDLVDILLRLQEENELDFPIENRCIKAVILEIFMAGSDTSSTTLEWAFSELTRNPRTMEKVQAEVRHVLNKREKVEQSDIHELKYLKLVIKETLRLHPPAPLLVPRESRERCEIDGYEIPKGAKVFVNAWAIGRDPEYWNDANEFIPERFGDLSIDYKGNDFEYIPFGAGKRICPGMSFGVANIELPLAQLLYSFDWKLPNEVIKAQELDMTELLGATVGRKFDLCLVPTQYKC